MVLGSWGRGGVTWLSIGKTRDGGPAPDQDRRVYRVAFPVLGGRPTQVESKVDNGVLTIQAPALLGEMGGPRHPAALAGGARVGPCAAGLASQPAMR